jgi:hypothetical protein
MNKLLSVVGLLAVTATPVFAQPFHAHHDTAWSGSAANRFHLRHGHYEAASAHSGNRPLYNQARSSTNRQSKKNR